MQQLLDMQRKGIDDHVTNIGAINANSLGLLIGLGLFGLLPGAACAWLRTIGITRPLNRAVKIALTVSSGGLTSHIEANSKDETGELLQALKDVNDSLVRIVGDEHAGTETISTASGEIAANNLGLSSRTEQQASSLEETASSMAELTVKQNADNAHQANQMVLSASETARRNGGIASGQHHGFDQSIVEEDRRYHRRH